MNRFLSKVLRTGKITNFRRNFLTGTTFYDASGQEESKYILKPISSTGHTFRKHNNEERQNLYEFGLYVAACLPKYVQKIQLQHTDELEILVAPEGIYPVCCFMRNHHNCCFNQCTGATAIDVPSRVYRFEVVYMLLSIRYSERVRIKTYTDELTPLRSQFANWYACNWYEREIFDMFGVVFTHHPDLRRILTDYGFNGHPFRKDFPLVGYTEVRYDDELKKLVFEPVEFAQEMRRFRLGTPWSYLKSFHEGYNLPKPEPKKKK
ncbi:unnamed protein product [Arctia plantaginis]|uniref:NADH dehydrogenase [ubiquinone] iron-sulfur protein 3, mitochondrial n=1 Tax=Arctia plantaginis TaxID=874455 RepID=A0A8S1A7N8_ARCPL|nr:unnamed protein product [Arctia plantaginis]CAB3240516.1 unnamed protein product [Arctia plantaginis]